MLKSKEEDCKGRVGLHSLPMTELFYTKSVQNDARRPGSSQTKPAMARIYGRAGGELLNWSEMI